jgi:large subunit ribosomal protein L25
MAKTFEIGADSRNDQGKGASRRLRHAGKVPAILYGGKGEPANVTLDQRQLLTVIDNEKFYSSIITIKVDGQPQPAIVKDVQMHPAKKQVMHVDLQRVLDDQPIRLHVPLHFLNQATAPGVKVQGGNVSHLMSDVEVLCLPKDLPEALELDMGKMSLNETLYLRDVPLPAGVTLPALTQNRNPPVVAIHAPRAEEPEPVAAEAAVAAATATPAAGAADAKKGAEAKPAGGEAKKEGGKK